MPAAVSRQLDSPAANDPAVVVITCLMLFARHLPVKPGWIYIGGLIGYGLLRRAIPQLAYMQKRVK